MQTRLSGLKFLGVLAGSRAPGDLPCGSNTLSTASCVLRTTRSRKQKTSDGVFGRAAEQPGRVQDPTAAGKPPSARCPRAAVPQATSKPVDTTQVEELLLNEPNNEEYADIYNSLTEVGIQKMISDVGPVTVCKGARMYDHDFDTWCRSSSSQRTL